MCFILTFFFDKRIQLTNHELVVYGERLSVSWELYPERAYDRGPGGIVLVEHSVPVRQEGIAEPECISHYSKGLSVIQPRLSPLCVQVWVSSEKWQESTCLINETFINFNNDLNLFQFSYSELKKRIFVIKEWVFYINDLWKGDILV